MRIAQISPLYESVPPKFYGGTERVVSYLTEELVRLGHDVTLFASGDSVTRARLRSQTPRALRLNPACIDGLAPHVRMLARVFREAEDFDILHFHLDYLHFPMARLTGRPVLTTQHGRLDLPDLVPLFREFSDMPLISISNYQRRPLPFANWTATIYHGLPRHLYRFYPGPGEYLAFLGRISPEKRVDRAIEIAVRCDLPLRIAAKVDKADEVYYREKIKPLLKHPLVTYLGEIGERDKNEFLGRALALLFPIDWPEPFGLVMVEALACGTPVIAFRNGSVPEVLEDGRTGFIVNSLEEAVAAVGKIESLNRSYCRQVFEARFTADRMARDYLKIYSQLRDSCHAWSRVA
jgi:glycosyltransferase involved in cell wall biosynthesis|uniref:Glycosyltransferase family 4 protein n=1 Tax=Desulfobacca acetoxidans TaxID=60893 RepID=A0A7C5AKV3_9BACT